LVVVGRGEFGRGLSRCLRCTEWEGPGTDPSR
jgi:hypothetical protein